MGSNTPFTDLINNYQNNSSSVINGDYSTSGVTPLNASMASDFLSKYTDMITAQTNAQSVMHHVNMMLRLVRCIKRWKKQD